VPIIEREYRAEFAALPGVRPAGCGFASRALDPPLLAGTVGSS